jgi:hypothetical protein
MDRCQFRPSLPRVAAFVVAKGQEKDDARLSRHHSSGLSPNPSCSPARRIRSSRLRSFTPGTMARTASADAKWIASRARMGSMGNGRLARSTISALSRQMCQCATAAFRCARRSAALASSISPSTTARINTRSHSMSVRSEAVTNSEPLSTSRTRRAPGSPSNHTNTALDSAYTFTGHHAPHREVQRHAAV